MILFQLVNKLVLITYLHRQLGTNTKSPPAKPRTHGLNTARITTTINAHWHLDTPKNFPLLVPTTPQSPHTSREQRAAPSQLSGLYLKIVIVKKKEKRVEPSDK
jgi:hypothetical protein